MIEFKVRCSIALAGYGLGCLAMMVGGCQTQPTPTQRPGTEPVPLTIAVGPALNQSGSTDFDPVIAGDIMASEVTRLGGIHVVGVNRVLAMMAELGLKELRHPGDAIEIAKRLGVDGILVFAITEYNPYSPPTIGVAAQLYLATDPSGEGRFDAVSTSRSGTAVGMPKPGSHWAPVAQVQRVFDGAEDQTVRELRSFALMRRADQSPYAWRKYLASQTHFLRFCSSRVADELVGQAHVSSGWNQGNLALNQEEKP